jgi:hypothetical protein
VSSIEILTTLVFAGKQSAQSPRLPETHGEVAYWRVKGTSLGKTMKQTLLSGDKMPDNHRASTASQAVNE